MSAPESPLLDQLSANSAPYRDPLAVLDWRALSSDRFWLPREAISLQGLPEFEALSEPARMRLSQFEFIGFAQAGIALERLYLEHTARRLRRAEPGSEYAYLLHEMREEAGHSLMFLKLAAASGLDVPDWRRALPRFARPLSRLALSDVMYWFLMVMAEDVPDKLNRFVRRHAGTEVCPLIRQMISLQMVAESRHITYARGQLEHAMSGRGKLAARVFPRLLDAVFNRFVRAYFWPRAELYERAGLGDGRFWRHLALASPHRREFVLRLCAPTMRLLAGHGIKVRLR